MSCSLTVCACCWGETVDDEIGLEAAVVWPGGLAWEAAPEERRVKSNGFEVVGATGLVGFDVDGSEVPSLVRFFLRNPPRLGIR